MTHHFERRTPRSLDGDPVGNRHGCRRLQQAVRRLGSDHGVGPLGLNADDFDLRRQTFYRFRHPGDQSAATDRNNDRPDFRQLPQNLQPDGSLPRHHRRIIKSVNKRQSVRRRQLFGPGIGFVIGRSRQHHFRAIAARGADFGQWRRFRHDNHGPDSCLPRRIGHALRMVSRRRRNHAVAFLCRRQQPDFIESAAQFEGARLLQVFQFQVDRLPHHRRKRRTGFERRFMGDSRQRPGRIANIFKIRVMIH